MKGSIAQPREKALFVDALTRAAAESGYTGVTVDRVADYAGLTPDDFYAHFEDLDQCLLAALEHFLDRLVNHMDGARDEGADWPQQVKLGIRAGVDFIMELERLSRVFLVEQSGPAAVELRLAAIGHAAEALRGARASYPVAAKYPEIMEQTLVSGVVLVVSRKLLAEEASLSSRLAEEVVELVLTPYLGRTEANRIAAE
jgi:AcrR family transcriptional regulator